MPGRNLLRVDFAGAYYHVYFRGVNGKVIFKTENDYTVFMALLKRYLSVNPAKDKNGVGYPHLFNKLELLCFCLMPNHAHLLVYQVEQGAVRKLMQSVMVSYSRYFNTSYARRGPLFESRYRASLISNQSYLEHISRYIHLNPKHDWENYPYSSLPYFIAGWQAEWLVPDKIAGLFNSASDYMKFLQDYEGHKRMLEEIKSELAI